MKKIFSLIFLSIIILSSCGSNDSSTGEITDQTKEENIIINWINDWNTFKKATISDDKSNEATEEIDITSTWEAATVTSFWSWQWNETPSSN